MRWSLFRSSPRRGVGGHTEDLRTFTDNWNCKNQQRGGLLLVPWGLLKCLAQLAARAPSLEPLLLAILLVVPCWS
jgi:hypothetical protein